MTGLGGRRVALDGAVNVRDIGGYRSLRDLDVTRGQVFRGDALSRLTDSDIERLSALGLRAVIDFRTSGEILLAGADRLPPGMTSMSLPVGGGDISTYFDVITSGDEARQRQALGDGRAADFMVAVNRGFVADPRQREQFATALHMITEGPRPLLYHCTGGKDRTGWMTAIVLTAIGVPRETVTRDYLLSNDYHRAGYQKLRADLLKSGAMRDPELIRPILEQSPTYLDAAFDEAERQYGSFPDFLVYGLGMTERGLRGLRDALLTDPLGLPAPAGAEPGQPAPGDDDEHNPEADLKAHVH